MTLVLDLEWFERVVAPLAGRAKSITFSTERCEQIKAAYKSRPAESIPMLAQLNTALVASAFMPDDMFVVVDSRGNYHPCKIGDSNHIEAEQ